MNDRMNTIFGWLLGCGIVALGTSIVSGMYFHADNAELGEDVQPGYVIDAPEEGAGADSGPPLAQLLNEGSAEAGAAVFAKCTACHTIASGGGNGIGPNLYGVMGTAIGAHAPGFAYSSALSEHGGNWDFENMNAWLQSPRAFAAGTKMSFAGLSSAEDRANVILYLLENGGGPAIPAFDAAAAEGAEDAEAAPGAGPGAVDGENPDASEAVGGMGDEQPVPSNPGT